MRQWTLIWSLLTSVGEIKICCFSSQELDNGKVLLRLAHLYEVVVPLLFLSSLYKLVAFFRTKLTRAVLGSTCCNPFLFSRHLLSAFVTSVRMNCRCCILMLYYNNAEFLFLVGMLCEKTGEDKDYSVMASVELKKIFPKEVKAAGTV